MVLQGKPRFDAVASAKVSKCEVQARRQNPGSSGQGVLMMGLELLHNQQVAMAQRDGLTLLGDPVADLEVSAGSKADRGDNGGVDFWFVVPVPPHGVLAIAVEVAQYGVKFPAFQFIGN